MVSLSISAATNRITTAGFAYDAAGHMTQWPGGTVTLGAGYDVEGRLSVVKQDGVNRWCYLYDARNRRVRKSNMSGTMPTYEVHGPGGELLGMYGWYWPQGAPSPVFRVEEERIYFAGRVAARLDETGSPNFGRMDRLGSVKAWQRYPFGEGNESNTYDEYATYPVDRSTGHYYAWNRFYSATWGRFSSPDPYVMSGGLTHPQGWNRYSYVGNDPVNYYDPTGLQRWMVTIYYSFCSWTGSTNTLNCTPGSYSYIVDDGVDGGEWGGGSGGSNSEPQPPGVMPRPIVTITNLSKTGRSYDSVNNRLTDIENQIDEDCLAFLQSGGYVLGRHIRDLRDSNLLAVGAFNRNKIAAITGTYGTNLPEGEAATVVNVNGAFFRGSHRVNQGNIIGGSALAQVFILLHELAHSLEAKGFLPDLNNASSGEANDKMIEANCAKTLERFK